MPHASLEVGGQPAACSPQPAPQCPHKTSKSEGSYLCPRWYLQKHIDEVKNIQAELHGRGGIFQSRSRAKHKSGPEWQKHLALRSRWRRSKVTLSNELGRMEKAVRNSKDVLGNRTCIEYALYVFNKEAENLAEVPGDYAEMTEEEVNGLVVDILQQLAAAIGGTGKDEDGDSAMEEEIVDTVEPEDEDLSVTVFPDSDVDSDSDSDSGPERHSRSDSGYGSGSEDVEMTDAEDAKESDASLIVSPESPTSVPESPATATTKTGRHVRFADHVTISPETLNFAPTLFPGLGINLEQTSSIPMSVLVATHAPLSSESTIRHHSKQTDVDTKRRKSTFSRGKPRYKAGRWVSPRGHEKVNTSCLKMTWDEAEAHWREEEQDAGQEKAVYDTLKVVSGTYVLQRVTPLAVWSYQKSRSSGDQMEGVEVSGSGEGAGA